MTNFIFKSANRLIKNSPLTEGYIMTKLENIQRELRHQRCDLKDIKMMLNRLMIEKHLQSQVDEYFDHESNPIHPEDTKDIDWWLLLERLSEKASDSQADITRLKVARLVSFTLDSPVLKRLVAECATGLHPVR